MFHMQQADPRRAWTGARTSMPPAIDPLAPKQHGLLARGRRVYICLQFGIDVDRPLLCQVSRFDPWKDPLGVIDAYWIVKTDVPDVQLALVGSMATDDPEGWDFFNATVAHADGDPDIHILNNLNERRGDRRPTNAFQSHCDVVIQKSKREGFGLTVTEAIWKARPFIGMVAVGGILLVIADGESGFPGQHHGRGVRPAGARNPRSTRALGKRLGSSRQGQRQAAFPQPEAAARLARVVRGARSLI